MTSKARATSTAQESETAAAELAAAQDAGTEPVEAQDEVVTAEAEPEQEEFIEHVGFPPYGAEFVDVHTLTRAQVKQAFDGLDLGRAELRWTKNAQGKMLVPTKDLSPEVVEALSTLPEFRLVTRNA